MRIDYLGLEAFVAIAELGSFNRAAAHLNLSQTALSHRIRKIEEDLGVPLLLRTTRGISLTQSGQNLLPQARHHLAQLSDIYGDMIKQGRSQKRRLSFACLPTLANHYLPQVLIDFAAEAPDTALQVLDQPVGRILDLVLAGEVEFGVTIIGAEHWDLEVRQICTEPYILLVNRNHPLAGYTSVSMADLVGHAFVRINTHSSNRQLVDDAMGAYSDRILWRYEVQNATTALSLVAAGAAITILPRLTAELTGDRVVGLPFSDVSLTRNLGVISRRGMPISRQGERLITMISAKLAAI